MKKKLLFVLLIFIAGSALAQDITANSFIKDLEYLKDTLPSKHKNLFAKISKTNFEQKIAGMESKASSLDYDSFTTELLKLIVSIGDEHTRIEPDYKKLFPVKFNIYKEGIFITRIDSVHSDFLLAKLLKINDQPINTVVKYFKQVVQSENTSFFDTGVLYLLNKPSVLKGLGIISSTDEIILTLQTATGAIQNLNLKSISKNEKLNPVTPASSNLLLANKKDSNYWFDYDQTNKTIYFKYDKCQEDVSNPFEKFNTELFKQIANYNPDKLIIDLRSNGGGNSGILSPFIDQIKNSYLNKKGKLFVLIGKATFSSALMNAVELKRNTNAILLGEPTSGNINHYGEVRGFKLPESKITIAYSTKYWETWKGKKGPLLPDVAVNYSIENLRKGQDEALNYVYQQ